MVMFELYNSFMRKYERTVKTKYKEINNNWDWYNIPGSIFGFDSFLSPLSNKNLLRKEDKEAFTKTLSDVIISNFEIVYNSLGMVLINKNSKIGRLETSIA